MTRTIYRNFFLFTIVVFLISGCASQGAKRIPADRFDYNAAIARSAREQMMLNIVRSRYQEMPMFLNISSVVSQYAYSAAIGLTGIRESASPIPSIYTGAAKLDLSYTELPTISYTPLSGQDFARHLYSEVPSDVFFAAVQGGWAIDVLMRIGVHRFGAAENMSFGEVRIKRTNSSELKNLEQFARAIELLLILSDGEVVEVHRVKGDAEKGIEPEQYFVIANEVSEDLLPMLAEFRQLTGTTGFNRFRITDRITNLKDEEITIQTRSVVAMMKFMARGIEIPGEYLEEGRVVDFGLQTSESGSAGALFPFRMRSSRNRPENVFAAVRHEDYWYYIDHADITSKRALEHIMILYQLRAPPSKHTGPLLTLPTR
jgi:hypothetical protein